MASLRAPATSWAWTNMPGSRMRSGLGNPALMLVFGTIFQPQDCPGSIVAGLLQPTAVQGSAQRQQFPGGLGHIHINGIELLDGRQRLGLTVADQGALGNGRTSDLSGDRRG